MATVSEIVSLCFENKPMAVKHAVAAVLREKVAEKLQLERDNIAKRVFAGTSNENV